MARRIPRRRGGASGNFADIPNDLRRVMVSALRNAAKDVLNDLAEAGPDWRGTFKDSWYVETADGRRGAQSGGQDGKYNLFNIPQLNVQGRNVRGQFSAAAPTVRTELFIGNFAPYAQEAMDLIPGIFKYPGVEPQGEEQPRGKRLDGIRGNLQPPGKNRSTAPLDWYSDYMNGGAFAAAFKRGARAGFLETRNRPLPPQ